MSLKGMIRSFHLHRRQYSKAKPTAMLTRDKQAKQGQGKLVYYMFTKPIIQFIQVLLNTDFTASKTAISWKFLTIENE